MGELAAAGLLAGTRVLDLSRYLPGPYCTRLLADLGADVVKVESPDGDPEAQLMPPVYRFLNRGKTIVIANLKDSGDLALVGRLLTAADVVVEGFRPGVADRLGVGYDAMVAHGGTAIYCSISGFGQSGPRRDEPGHNLTYEASAGSLAGAEPGQPLAPPHVPVADLGSANFATISICAALADRSAHGRRPRRLDVSMQETVAYMAVSRWPDPAAEIPLAHFSPGMDILRTADGRDVTVAAVEDHFWLALCRALNRPGLADGDAATHAGRMRDRTRLRDAVREAAATMGFDELYERLRAFDVPAEPVRTVGEVFEDPHLLERKAFVQLPDGVVPDYPVTIDGHRSWAGPKRRVLDREAAASLWPAP
jgi:crotonobetainyl-CoA:carnitine CoA-transferase CaiB-like acyl-CoA transferase